MKKLLIILVFISSVLCLHAQPWMQAPYITINNKADSVRLNNFYEIQKAFQLYEAAFEKKIVKEKNNGEEDEGKFPGYTQFKRWEWFMAPRVYPSGDITLPLNNYNEFQKYLDSNDCKKINLVAENISDNWIPLGPTGTVATTGGDFTGAARVNEIRFDPANSNIMWTCTPHGGLWKSTDGGLNWSTNTDQLAILGCADIAINPANNQIMYLATGDANWVGGAFGLNSIGILKSTDGGISWPVASNTLNWNVSWNRRIYKILINPDHPDTILAATTIGILRSDNGGNSWNNIQLGEFTDLLFKPSNSNIVYAASGVATGGGFYKSTNAGVSFIPVLTGLPPANTIARTKIAVTEADSNYVYFLAVNSGNSNFNGLYRSVDGGNTFALRSNTPEIINAQGFYNLAMAVSSLHRDTLLVGGFNCWRSNDGGSTWTKITREYGGFVPYVHPDHHDLEFLPGTDSVYFSCNDGGIFKSIDRGVTWNPLNQGMQISQIYKLGTSRINPYKILTGNQDMWSQILKSGTWSVFSANVGDGTECLFEYTNDTIAYITGQYGLILKAINSIPLFNIIATTTGAGINGLGDFVTPIIMHPTQQSTLLVGKAQVWRTINSGASFTQVGDVTGGGTNVIALAYAPSNPNYIYAVKHNRVFISNDGNTFGDSTHNLPTVAGFMTAIAVSSSNPLAAWITFSGYSAADKIWKTTNGGSTWSNYSAGLPNLPVNCIVYQNNTANALYVGTDVGVYFISDSLASWQPFFSGLPNVDVDELEIAYSINKIRAATNGRGLWESNLAINSGGVLPIELISVTGYNKDKNNYINWSTSSSGQTVKFEIERSSDSSVFFKIGALNAHGNLNTNTDYTFIDYDVPVGLSYYRLHKIDLNGELSYSKTIAIRNSPTQFHFEVIPIPFKDELKVKIYSERNQPAKLQIIDIHGRVILSQMIFTSNLRLSTSSWASGVYFLKINNEMTKIVKE